ncbi:hypothetical protein [Marinobacter sp. CHS3-4]|uniref:hypothetical protein n=1 Tax=Marinobacter sp. CHS3-4 TaxID=3045174 RepID=UPI0024B5A9D1|nr:hypothetical protein [Marinobacter sp. CHS3-4]MDI9245011.1 hypothetical protein [Marinobacter sp. CHS3-4]
MRQDAFKYAVPFTICLGLSPLAMAELEPISDKEMSQVQGQALMTVNNVDDGTHSFTRVTMGMDVKTRLNVDNAIIGGDGSGADLDVSDLALGHYVRDDTRVQIDGQTYNVDDIVRFQGAQPYFELARNGNDLAGFRMGFGEARGTLSGNFASFSGNLGIKLDDGTGTGTTVDATLFDDAGVATNHRATQIGIPGAEGTCSSSAECVPLTNIKSMDIGVDNGDGTVGFTNDLFLAFQQESVDWQQVNGAGTIQGPQGVFMNLPTAMTLDMQTLQNGVQRERTHYVDRGTGMF